MLLFIGGDDGGLRDLAWPPTTISNYLLHSIHAYVMFIYFLLNSYSMASMQLASCFLFSMHRHFEVKLILIND